MIKGGSYSAGDRSARQRFISDIFGSEKLSGPQIKAVMRVYDHLSRKDTGGRLPDTDAFMRKVNGVLKKQYGRTLESVFSRTRTYENVMLRTFCLAAYRNTFPSHSLERAVKAFGGYPSRCTMQIALHNFPTRLAFEPEVAAKYAEFIKEL